MMTFREKFDGFFDTLACALVLAALPGNRALLARAVIALVVFAGVALAAVRLPLLAYAVLPALMVALYFCARIYLLAAAPAAAGGEV